MPTKEELSEMKKKAGLVQTEAEYKVSKLKEEGFYSRLWRASVEIQRGVRTDSTGYGYKYCSIQNLFKLSKPVLNQERIGFFQNIGFHESKEGVHTFLVDLLTGKKEVESFISFQEIESEKEIKKGKDAKGNETEKTIHSNSSQEKGAQITYFRRYALFTILGIQPEVDTDGKSAKNVKSY